METYLWESWIIIVYNYEKPANVHQIRWDFHGFDGYQRLTNAEVLKAFEDPWDPQTLAETGWQDWLFLGRVQQIHQIG